MSWKTTSNSLVLWFTLTDGKTGAPLDFHSRLSAEVVDEHGCSSSDQTYGSMSSGSGPTVYVDTFSQFPRRQAMFRVRLRERFTVGALSTGGGMNNVVAEFEVPNPTRGPFPVWKPEPLPAARTNAELVFILKDAGNPRPGPAWSGPRIDIVRGGLPAWDWERDELYVSEATGNRGQRPFCTNEPAWKLEVEFVRNEQASFLPSELYTITNLTVPAGGVAIQYTNEFVIQGSRLALCALTGPGRYRFSNTVVTLSEPLAPGQEETTMSSSGYQGTTRYFSFELCSYVSQVSLDVSSLLGVQTGAQDLRLLLRARGPDGVVHRLERRHTFGRLWLFTLTGVTNGQSFDLDVIVHRPRRAEFLVTP
jgi:hypothetical protein